MLLCNWSTITRDYLTLDITSYKKTTKVGQWTCYIKKIFNVDRLLQITVLNKITRKTQRIFKAYFWKSELETSLYFLNPGRNQS